MKQQLILSRRRLFHTAGIAIVSGLAGCAIVSAVNSESLGFWNISHQCPTHLVSPRGVLKTNSRPYSDDDTGDDNETPEDYDEDDEETNTSDDEDDREDDETSDDEEDDDEDDDDQEQEENDDVEEGDDDFSTFLNEEMGYEIEYPSGWDVDESWLERVEIWLQGSNHQILITVFESVEEHSIAEVSEEAISDTELSMDDVEVLSETDLQIESGEEGRVIEWQYANPQDMVDLALHSKLLLVLVEDVVYQIEVATGEQEYDDAFDDLVESVLTSFTITEVPEPEDTAPSVEDLTTSAND